VGVLFAAFLEDRTSERQVSIPRRELVSLDDHPSLTGSGFFRGRPSPAPAEEVDLVRDLTA